MLSFKDQKYLLSYLQIIAICLSGFIGLVFFGLNISFSLFIGGLCWFFPSLYFSKKVFGNTFPPKLGQTGQSLLMTFLGGEFKKLVFSGILVIICVHYLPIKTPAFLCGFFLALLSIWFYPLVYKFL